MSFGQNKINGRTKSVDKKVEIKFRYILITRPFILIS